MGASVQPSSYNIGFYSSQYKRGCLQLPQLKAQVVQVCSLGAARVNKEQQNWLHNTSGKARALSFFYFFNFRLDKRYLHMIKKLFLFFAKKDLTRSLKMNYNYYNGSDIYKKNRSQLSAPLDLAPGPQLSAPRGDQPLSSQLLGGNAQGASLGVVFPGK